MDNQTDNIVFFDGECVLCCGSVNLIIKNDPKEKFKFAPLQSDFAKKAGLNQVLSKDLKGMESIVLLRNGRFYTKSKAALEIASQLKFPYPLLYAFVVIPGFLRDLIYDIVAKNRYKWFGKKEECLVPTENIKRRFIA